MIRWKRWRKWKHSRARAADGWVKKDLTADEVRLLRESLQRLREKGL